MPSGPVIRFRLPAIEGVALRAGRAVVRVLVDFVSATGYAEVGIWQLKS
jgi:hypothetical protein